MNKLYRDVQQWTKCSDVELTQIMHELDCSGIDYSESTNAQLKRAAMACLATVRTKAAT